MRKVRIKTWDEMLATPGVCAKLDYPRGGLVEFSQVMEGDIPKDRVIDLEDGMWHDWAFEDWMIAEVYPDETTPGADETTPGADKWKVRVGDNVLIRFTNEGYLYATVRAVPETESGHWTVTENKTDQITLVKSFYTMTVIEPTRRMCDGE